MAATAISGHPLPLFTDCGIPGIRSVPYGVHLCHFYPTRQELVDSLVPYIVAGLQSNERCVWVTAEPLPGPQAKAELAKIVPDIDTALRDGRLTIIDARDWYGKALSMPVEEMTAFWVREEEKALARGFRGLRATGNVTGNRRCVTPDSWHAVMEYESVLARAFQGRRIVTLCSYGHEQCGAGEVRDVMRRHHYALERIDETWQVSEAPFASGRPRRAGGRALTSH